MRKAGRERREGQIRIVVISASLFDLACQLSPEDFDPFGRGGFRMWKTYAHNAEGKR